VHDGVLMSLPSLLGDGECARYVAVHYRISGLWVGEMMNPRKGRESEVYDDS